MTGLRPDDLKRIALLHPDVRFRCLDHVQRCEDAGLHVFIPQCYRTRAEQQAIWQKGRNDDGQIVQRHLVVTHSPPGWSFHEYGLAYDVVLVLPDLRTVSWDVAADTDKDSIPDYLEIARLGRRAGMESGMFWPHPDVPHFEYHPRLSIHECVQKFGLARQVPDDYFWRMAHPSEEVKA